MRANVRTKHPLIIWILGVTLGQYAVLHGSAMSVTLRSVPPAALLLGAVLLCWRVWRARRTGAAVRMGGQRSARRGAAIADLRCALFVGLLSVVVILPPWSTPRSFQAHEHYLAVVDREPRRRKVGAVELSLTIRSVGTALVGSVGDPARATEQTRNSYPPARVLCRAIDLPWRNAAALIAGDLVSFQGRFTLLRHNLDPFDYQSTLRRHGYDATCRIDTISSALSGTPPLFVRWREQILRRVSEAVGDDERSGLLLSMSIGMRDTLSDRTERIFKRCGLAHLLVVSGYQMTMVFQLLERALRAGLLRCPALALRIPSLMVARLCALIATAAFAGICGFDSSVNRALVSLMIVVVAQGSERSAGFRHAIMLALLCLSISWPLAILEPGTQLTFAALFGLEWGSRFYRTRPWLSALSACTAAGFATSLISLLWFAEISLLGFILNPIVAGPLSFLSCNCGVAAIGLLMAGADPSGICASAVAAALAWTRDLLGAVASSDVALIHLESSVARLVVCAAFFLTVWIAGRLTARKSSE